MANDLKIIINADDFGLCHEVNEAVHDSCEKGVLTSATLMANMPGFDEAVSIAKDLGRLGVGIHLNILRGSPLSDPAKIPTLVNRDGKFLGDAMSLWMKFISHRIDIGQVELELDAQMKRVIESGIKPTHIDSEKHLLHLFPALWSCACSAAVDNGIGAIRIVRERLDDSIRSIVRSPSQFLKLMILNKRGRGLLKVASGMGLKSCDGFFGVADTGRMVADRYRSFLANNDSGSFEIMTHPAVASIERAYDGETSWLDRARINEYRALIDGRTKEVICESGAKLINYNQL